MAGLVLGGVLVAAMSGAPAAAAPPAGQPAAVRAVEMLHDGRFDAAAALLDGIPDAEAGPDVLFFRAFVTYWRLLYDENAPALRSRLASQLGVLITRAEDGPARRRDDALWEGSAHLLLSQLRAIEKKPFAAAVEAKRARRDLQGLDGDNGLAVEALFGLGTYNYMADRLPAFVKGLRALLFLPGGDRDLGLTQIDRAARESRYFAVEARLLLVTIYANRHERLYDDAIEQAALARAARPGAIVVAHASAKILIALARPAEAAEILDRALERARTLGDVDPGVVATLDLHRARADFASFRPDLAAARARELHARATPMPADVREDARVLAIEAGALAARPWWPEARAVVVGGPSTAANGSSAAHDPGAERTAVLSLLRGRAELADGRPAEALTQLAAAAAAPDLPTPWVGPARLLAGQAADLAGQRARAIAFYKKAADSPGFLARDAAYAFQARPFRAAPR